MLRSNGRLIKDKGAHVYNRWIKLALERNIPMDRFVRELITAEGSSYKNPAANYYRISRDPENSVETTAQLFLGVRIQCAKCHNHPFERWTQDDYYGFAAFFSRVRFQEGSYSRTMRSSSRPRMETCASPRTGKVMSPKCARRSSPQATPRSPIDGSKLATWLTGPENPFFRQEPGRQHASGTTSWAGESCEPVDDFRDSNPPVNDELLDGLTAEFVKQGYDLKKLIRSVLVSRTYQLSADRRNERETPKTHSISPMPKPSLLPRRGSSRRDFERDWDRHRVRRPSQRVHARFRFPTARWTTHS